MQQIKSCSVSHSFTGSTQIEQSKIIKAKIYGHSVPTEEVSVKRRNSSSQSNLTVSISLSTCSKYLVHLLKLTFRLSGSGLTCQTFWPPQDGSNYRLQTKTWSRNRSKTVEKSKQRQQKTRAASFAPSSSPPQLSHSTESHQKDIGLANEKRKLKQAHQKTRESIDGYWMRLCEQHKLSAQSQHIINGLFSRCFVITPN